MIVSEDISPDLASSRSLSFASEKSAEFHTSEKDEMDVLFAASEVAFSASANAYISSQRFLADTPFSSIAVLRFLYPLIVDSSSFPAFAISISSSFDFSIPSVSKIEDICISLYLVGSRYL